MIIPMMTCMDMDYPDMHYSIVQPTSIQLPHAQLCSICVHFPLFLCRTSSSSSIGADAPDSGSGPLKAKRKMPSRKASTENLLADNGGEKSSGPVRASSLEDIHSLSSKQQKQQSGKTGLAAKIVDGAVKLYSPDHTHKYVDVSPVSTYSV